MECLHYLPDTVWITCNGDAAPEGVLIDYRWINMQENILEIELHDPVSNCNNIVEHSRT